MSLCGLPEPDPNHAEKMIRTAVEMVQYIEKRNLESSVEWQIRIGIHSGDVIAGVVGIKNTSMTSSEIPSIPRQGWKLPAPPCGSMFPKSPTSCSKINLNLRKGERFR